MSFDSRKWIDFPGRTAGRFNPLERRLMMNYQDNFPLSMRPFDDIADELSTTERDVLAALKSLQSSSVISRVGPVFYPRRIGVSTLAAMAIPADRLDEVARIVDAYPEVNHNYEREHHFNLWFVLAAADKASLSAVLADIRQRTGEAVMVLPMLEDYSATEGHAAAPCLTMPRSGNVVHLDNWRRRDSCRLKNTSATATASDCKPQGEDVRAWMTPDRARLITAVQDGLPLVSRPYREVARRAGMSEDEVMQQLVKLQVQGIIKRIGLVVRQSALCEQSCALVVWDVPDVHIARLGRSLSASECVTQCYRRPRRLPEWGYNLFCMIRGADHETVWEYIHQLTSRCGLQEFPREVMFSRRCFKQRGAHYVGQCSIGG